MDWTRPPMLGPNDTVMVTRPRTSFGLELIGELLTDRECAIVAVLTPDEDETAMRDDVRFAMPRLPTGAMDRLDVVHAAIDKRGLGLPADEWQSLAARFTHMVHEGGGSPAMTRSEAIAYTQTPGLNVHDLVLAAVKLGHLKGAYLMSTVYSPGGLLAVRAEVAEWMPAGGPTMPFAAANLALERMWDATLDPRPPCGVLRMGLLVGNQGGHDAGPPGWAPRLDGPVYDLIELVERGAPAIRGNPVAPVPAVGRDWVARMTIAAMEDPGAIGQTINLTTAGQAMTLEEFALRVARLLSVSKPKILADDRVARPADETADPSAEVTVLEAQAASYAALLNATAVIGNDRARMLAIAHEVGLPRDLRDYLDDLVTFRDAARVRGPLRDPEKWAPGQVTDPAARHYVSAADWAGISG